MTEADEIKTNGVGLKRTKRQSKITDSFGVVGRNRNSRRGKGVDEKTIGLVEKDDLERKRSTAKKTTKSHLFQSDNIDNDNDVDEIVKTNIKSHELAFKDENAVKIYNFPIITDDQLEIKPFDDDQLLVDRDNLLQLPAAYQKFAHLIEKEDPANELEAKVDLEHLSTLESSTFITASNLKDLSPLPAYKRFAHLVKGEKRLESSLPSPSSIIEKEGMDKNENHHPLLSKSSISIAPLVLDLPKVPAYQRFSHLVADSRPILPLSMKFQLLDKILGALDSLCMLSAARDQPVIFCKCQRTLESSVGRRVELVHLKQIHGMFINSDRKEKSYLFRKITVVHEGKRQDSIALELPKMATHEYLADRRSIVQVQLRSLLVKSHQEFLDAAGIQLPKDSVITRWHPKFDLESVPYPEPVELLPLPVECNIPTTELVITNLNNNDVMMGHANKIPNIIKEAINETLKHDTKEPSSITLQTPPVEVKKSTSVLERIKAKQRELEAASIAVNPEKEKLLTKYKGLLDFSETIAMLFATMSKSTMLLGDVINKLGQGSKNSTSSNEIIERIGDLVDVAPEWIKITNAGAIKTLRIEKSIPLNIVKDKIRTRMSLV